MPDLVDPRSRTVAEAPMLSVVPNPPRIALPIAGTQDLFPVRTPARWAATPSASRRSSS